MSEVFWTYDRVKILHSLWSNTRSQEIGDRLGCTSNAVIGKANRIGLPPITRAEKIARMGRSQRAAHRVRGNCLRGGETRLA